MKQALTILLIIFFTYSFSGTVIVTNTNDSGAGSLRASIALANSGDTVRFSSILIASGSDSIVLSSTLFFRKSLTIKGLYNSTDTLYISGGNSVGVMRIDSADDLVLDSLVIINGTSYLVGGISCSGVKKILVSNCIIQNNHTTSNSGGGIKINNVNYLNRSSYAIIKNCIINNNKSTSGGGISFKKLTGSTGYYRLEIHNSTLSNNSTFSQDGGGISTADVPVILSNCTIINNYAQANGGGIEADSLAINNSIIANNTAVTYGGGIETDYLIINSTSVSNNYARFGGGIYTNGLIMQSCKITNNSSQHYGGGICIPYTHSNTEIHNSTIESNFSAIGGGFYLDGHRGNPIQFINSTFNNNTASTKGGGIYVKDWNRNTIFTIKTNTISNNSASQGGGIYIDIGGRYRYTRLNIENTTIVDNTASLGGGIYYYHQFGTFQPVNNIYLKSSIVSLNGTSNIYNTVIQKITSFGYNILGDTNILGSISTDLFNNNSSSLNLGALQDNGGITKTKMPNTGSIVINNGDTTDLSNAQNWPIRDSIRDAGAAERVCIQTIIDTINRCYEYISTSGRYTWRTSGVFLDTVFGNCDTIIVTNLTIQNSVDTVTIDACYTYVLPSGNDTLATSGIYFDTISNHLGCDSNLTIKLFINTKTFDTIDACGIYTNIQGTITYNTVGNYSDTTTNSKGCDSIINVNVINNVPSYETISVTKCEKYITPSGIDTITITGTFFDTIQNKIGCDSIITIILVIYPKTFDSVLVTACEYYLIPSGLRVETTSRIFNDTILNFNGCDSVININLTILNHTTFNTSKISCRAYTSVTGKIYNTTGLYFDTLINSVGCDSLITTLFTRASINNTVNQSGINLSANLTGAVYQWLDCNNGNTAIAGATNQQFTPTINGNYAVIVSNSVCSDTSACLSVNSVGVGEIKQAVYYKLYPNPTKDFVNLEVSNSNAKIELNLYTVSGKEIAIDYQIAGNTARIEWDYLPSGIYTLQIKLNNILYHSKLIIK